MQNTVTNLGASIGTALAGAIVTGNANARIDGLRSSLALLAIIALITLFATRRIPAQQPTASPKASPQP